MSDEHPGRTRQDDPHREAGARRKKPYEKPTLRCEPVFETTALACGKIEATQGQCRLNRKAS